MTISEDILVAESLRANASGFEFLVRINWYRSLPLSCVNTLEVRVDGQPVDRSDLRFGINGRDYGLDELPSLVEESWYVQDCATVKVRRQPATRPGERLEIALQLGCLIPYILIGPATALENRAAMTRTMVAQ